MAKTKARLSQLVQISCPHCGHKQEQEIYVSLAPTPQLLRCHVHCGKGESKPGGCNGLFVLSYRFGPGDTSQMKVEAVVE
jgi:hypothetical protein